MTSLHAVTNLVERRPPSVGPADRLPRPLSSFLGREEEIAALTALVADAEKRLVTVTGPGGIGKTRLALEVAQRCQHHFRDGVLFAGLADVRNPDLLPGVLALALRANDAPGSSPAEQIRHTCEGMNLLLVVDNAEHLLEAAPLLSELLGWCPGMTMLVTSRETLRLAGEYVFGVSPLPDDLAVDLFGERAGAIVPGFEISAESRPAIVEICRHLDGLPLAIELAAARIPVLTPGAMLERLDNLMGLLSGGRRDAPDRHRGMRETIAWSYNLLTDHEQRLFRALAVFEGGFTLEGATAIVTSEIDALACFTALEASSLVKPRRDQKGNPRFRMLETVREFAWEQLRIREEERTARRRQAEYITELAEDTERRWWSASGLDKLDQIERELPNIRAALTWLQMEGDVPGVLQLAGSLAPLWGTRSYGDEGRAWLKWALPQGDSTPTNTLIVAVRAYSWVLLNRQRDLYTAFLCAQYALALANEIDDGRNRVASCLLGGIAADRLGLFGEARRWCTMAYRELDRYANEAWAPVSRCVALNHLFELEFESGNIALAEILLAEVVSVQAHLGQRFTAAGHVFRGLGDIARACGDPDLAMVHYRNALNHALNARDTRAIGQALGAIGGALAELGNYVTAGRLFGFVEAEHTRIGYPFVQSTFAIQRALGLPEPWSGMHRECDAAEGLRRAQWERTASVRAVSLDADLARSWWNEGRALTIDEAVALIPLAVQIEELASTANETFGLSDRQVEVLRLIAQGLSNHEIATALFISPRTAQNHVQHIYQKINVSSRSAATRWAMVHGID